MRDSFAGVDVARFDHHTLVRIQDADEIEMRTERSDGVRTARPIWVVVVDGTPYVRSYLGERGAWHRQARARGRAEIGVDGEDVAVGLTPAAGGELDKRISAAYQDKYGRRSPGPTEAMVTPQVVATTLRLEPLAADD